MLIPGTMLNVESKKVEIVKVSGPHLSEALEYCQKHNLQIQDSQNIPQSVTRSGEMQYEATVVAMCELNLVEV